GLRILDLEFQSKIRNPKSKITSLRDSHFLHATPNVTAARVRLRPSLVADHRGGVDRIGHLRQLLQYERRGDLHAVPAYRRHLLRRRQLVQDTDDLRVVKVEAP